MKTKPILVLLCFVGAVAVTGWMYYALRHPSHEATPTATHSGLHDLEDCCRRKTLKAAQYDHFAHLAHKEQALSTAILFRALAHSERIQEANCATIIRQLGGTYRPPMRILLFDGSTRGNLRRSIDYERRQSDSLFHTRIAFHRHHGYRRIAEALIRSAIIDFRHQQLLEAQLNASPECISTYAVCPACGNIYPMTACDPYCPHCQTEQQQFVVIGL
jgi:rubrerythrin